MAGDKKTSWRETRRAERNRNLLMFLIPLMIIILIAVIMIADRSSGRDSTEDSKQTAESVTETAAETPEGSIASEGTAETDLTESGTGETEPAAEAGSGELIVTQLKKDEIPQINALMEAYCQARVNCDAEALYRLYGRTDINGIEEERAKMLLNARYIQTFEDIVCYTMEGLEDKSWLVYMRADIKFRSAETPAPTVMWCYVTEDEESSFTITDPKDLTPEQNGFIEEATKMEDVRNLKLQVDTRLGEAVASDPELAGIYGTLHSGSPLWETDAAETEPEPEVRVLPE